MAHGIASGSWGISIPQVAGMVEYGNDSYTNQLSLTSRFGASSSECTKFRNDSCINPATGRPIKKYGKVYNNLVESCKVVFGNSGTPQRENGGKRNIFVGSRPSLPGKGMSSITGNERNISYGNQNVKHNYLGEPRYISINNKKYSIGDSAKIFPDGKTGKITKIGPNNIIFSKSDGRERRLTVEQFVNLNSSRNNNNNNE